MRNNSQNSSLNAGSINELNKAAGTLIQLNELLTEFFDAGSHAYFEDQLNELLYDAILCDKRTNESKGDLFTTTRLIAELIKGLHLVNVSLQIKEGDVSC